MTESSSELLPEAQVEITIQKVLPDKVTAGDRVEMRVMFPPSAAGAEPEGAETLASQPLVHGQGKLLAWKKISDTEGTLTWTSYTPGNQSIPPIKFIKDGKAVFATPAQSVVFASLGTNAQQEKDDIYPPIPTDFPMWVVAGSFALALLVFLAFVWWLVRWSKKRQKQTLELAKIPKTLTALEDFEKRRFSIEMKNFLDTEQYKPHYFGFSEAAKKFLARAYRFDAEDKTTRELVCELESIGMADVLIDSWEKIFEEMDVVKFTDQRPAKDAAFSLAIRLTDLVRSSYATSPAAKEAMSVAAHVQSPVKKGDV